MKRYLDYRKKCELIILNRTFFKGKNHLQHILEAKDFKHGPEFYPGLHSIQWQMIQKGEPMICISENIDFNKLGVAKSSKILDYLLKFYSEPNIGVVKAFECALFMLEHDMLFALYGYLQKRSTDMDVKSSDLAEYQLIHDSIEYIDDPEYEEINMMDKMIYISETFKQTLTSSECSDYCERLLDNVSKKMQKISESRKEEEALSNFMNCDIESPRTHAKHLQLLRLLFVEFYNNDEMPHTDCYDALYQLAKVVGAHKRVKKEMLTNKIDELLKELENDKA